MLSSTIAVLEACPPTHTKATLSTLIDEMTICALQNFGPAELRIGFLPPSYLEENPAVTFGRRESEEIIRRIEGKNTLSLEACTAALEKEIYSDPFLEKSKLVKVLALVPTSECPKILISSTEPPIPVPTVDALLNSLKAMHDDLPFRVVCAESVTMLRPTISGSEVLAGYSEEVYSDDESSDD